MAFNLIDTLRKLCAEFDVTRMFLHEVYIVCNRREGSAMCDDATEVDGMRCGAERCT